MICSSVNLLRFMSVSFAGEQTNLEVRAFQGSRSVALQLTRIMYPTKREHVPFNGMHGRVSLGIAAEELSGEMTGN